MKQFLALLLMPATAFAGPVLRNAPVGTGGTNAVAPVASTVHLGAPSLLSGPSISRSPAESSLIIPEGEPGLYSPEKPSIIMPAPKKLILPEPKKIITETESTLVEADRALTEEEQAVETMPSKAELDRLAKSLTSEDDDSGPNAAAGAEAKGRSIGAAFDGSVPMSAEDRTAVAGYFYSDRPHAPELAKVRNAALRMFRGLLPAFYRRVPTAARYDLSPNGSTGHLWSAETGHIIEIAPIVADERGEVSSAFAIPGMVRVQQKVEQVLEFAHEYAHVIFDAEVKKAENHPPLSAYSAMTEGFAVTLEQALIDRAVSNPGLLGLSPRDVGDFLAIARGRRNWLSAVDSHYSEGIVSWRKAFEKDGVAGVAKLLASLSSHRMVKTQRSDPAYQLAVEEPELTVAYLGKDPHAPYRAGLDAVKKAASGEALDAEETKAAAEAIEKAGPGGRRRVFERSLLEDKRVSDARAPESGGAWWEKGKAAPVDIGAAFALARLSAVAAEELAVFLTETLRSGGGANLFGPRGPNEKLNAVVSEAERLPFTEEDKASWTEALTQWLFAGFQARSAGVSTPGISGKDGVSTSAPLRLGPKRFAIVGPPGAGKPTQATALASDTGIVHISVGRLLREYAKDKPAIQRVMNAGELVDTALVMRLVRERLSRADVRERGFVLDGFPRRPVEEEALLGLLREDGIELDGVIRLDAPSEELERRILARGRADDKPEVFAERMRVYERDTLPVIERLGRRYPTVRPDGRTTRIASITASLRGRLAKLFGR